MEETVEVVEEKVGEAVQDLINLNDATNITAEKTNKKKDGKAVWRVSGE